MKKSLILCFSLALCFMIPVCIKDTVFPVGSRDYCEEGCHTDADCQTGLKCRGFYNQAFSIAARQHKHILVLNRLNGF